MGKRVQALVVLGLALLLVPVYVAAKSTDRRVLDRFVYMPFLARPVVTVGAVTPTLAAATPVQLESTATPVGIPVDLPPTTEPWDGGEATVTPVDGIATPMPTLTPLVTGTPYETATPALE